jgi:preprotein translocase subunit SecE
VTPVATQPVPERPGPARRLSGFLQGVVAYLQEVRAEVRKITWPTRDELRRTTFVIIVFVIVIGIIIGIMDVIASKVLIDLLGRIFR